MKKFKVSERLSDVPSEALRQAVSDAKACEEHPDFTLNMGTWHGPTNDGTCHVCLAGAGVARRTRIGRHTFIGPSNMGPKIAAKMRGLDDFRTGYIATALEKFGVPTERAYRWPDRIHDYGDDDDYSVLFSQLLKLARDLKSAGL